MCSAGHWPRPASPPVTRSTSPPSSTSSADQSGRGGPAGHPDGRYLGSDVRLQPRPVPALGVTGRRLRHPRRRAPAGRARRRHHRGLQDHQGTWFSAYDGKTVTDPQDIDIDHMVPLANAWRTGAASWTDEQREEFANDLDAAAADRRHVNVDQPLQGRPGPVRVEAAAARLLVRLRPVRGSR